MTGAAAVCMCLALSDPVLCRSVQPEQGDKVDVLYKVQGRNAYFRGTVLRVANSQIRISADTHIRTFSRISLLVLPQDRYVHVDGLYSCTR